MGSDSGHLAKRGLGWPDGSSTECSPVSTFTTAAKLSYECTLTVATSLRGLSTMNEDSSLTCVCGRSFAQPGGLAYHHRSCKKNKVRCAGALRTAKDAWTSRKRRRFEAVQSEHKNLPPQDVEMEVHEANAMDAEVQIFPWIHFRTNSRCLRLLCSTSTKMKRTVLHWGQSLPPLKYFVAMSN